MRRSFAAFLVACFVLSCPLAARGAEHPWNNKRIYYVIEFMGGMIERGYFIRRPGSYQKKTCWVLEEEKQFFRVGGNQAPMRTVRTRTLTSLDGFALQRTEASLMGDGGQETISIIGDEAHIEATGAYGMPDVVPVPTDVQFEITGEWLAGHRHQRGKTYNANVLDRMTRGVVTTEVTILEREIPASGGAPAVWQADIATPGRPPVRARYTSDGRLLRLEGSGMVYQVVTREFYELGRIPAPAGEPGPDGRPASETGDELAGGRVDERDAGSGGGRSQGRPGTAEIPIGASVPAWDNFAWLQLHAGPAYDWATAIGESEYAQVEPAGAVTIITAIQNAPSLDSDVNFPMRIPAEVQPYLGASELLPSDHTAVIEAAYVAVTDGESKREERNVLRAVSYLAGWINQYVAVEEWNGYESSALETLANRSGDSLGHARLFSAMARTLGVPTRLCQGFMASRGGAVNHCWAEAWINGGWVPVDTTVSRVGLPAGYVLAERGDGGGAFRFDFASFMRSPGLGLRLVSAGRDTPNGQGVEMVVGDRRTYAVSEGDWMANLYWGFALRLPRSWKGQARLNSVTLTSPDDAASVRCEALEGDFQAGQPELERTMESLRSNLDRFRAIDSRVVAFDEQGATPALFIDFTCVRDGRTLRCRQYVVPRRQRAFRISFWAPSGSFSDYSSSFDRILASFEF